MHDSRERIRRVFEGDKPDRVPLFDLIKNDAVLEHFGAGRPVMPGDTAGCTRAISSALDGTRSTGFAPNEERVETLADGRRREYQRWTTWNEHVSYASSEDYARIKRERLAGWRAEAARPLDISSDEDYQRQMRFRRTLPDDFCFLLGGPSPGLMGLHTEVGLEQFSYCMADCPEALVEQLERNTALACRWYAALPADMPFEAVFIGEDIAFKTGPMMSPAWLRREYFPRLARVIAAAHAAGLKVMFHSDGNLNSVMDDLVACGIDALNPIEVAAGMDIADLHRRYPRLIFAGGIDVSNLLPFGTPSQVRDAVVKAIDDSEGRILVGSSTEILNSVPLENFLALREAAMAYKL